MEWATGSGNIEPGGRNVARIPLGDIPYGETIFEFLAETAEGPQRLLYVQKPMLLDFDINLGWAVKDLARSEAFIKTARVMHFNTVHGGNTAYTSQAGDLCPIPVQRL
jgi:hypothetical protein